MDSSSAGGSRSRNICWEEPAQHQNFRWSFRESSAVRSAIFWGLFNHQFSTFFDVAAAVGGMNLCRYIRISDRINVMRGNISRNVSLSCCSNCTVNSTMIFHRSCVPGCLAKKAEPCPSLSQLSWQLHRFWHFTTSRYYRRIGFSWVSCGFCLKGYQKKQQIDLSL